MGPQTTSSTIALANAVRDRESHVRPNPGETQRLINPPPLPQMKPPWTPKSRQPTTHLRLQILLQLKRLPLPKQHHRQAMLKPPMSPRSFSLVLPPNPRVSVPPHPRLKASGPRQKNSTQLSPTPPLPQRPENPFLACFIKALTKSGSSRTRLMTKVTGEVYYNFRALHF